jgi:hypothetical protein
MANGRRPGRPRRNEGVSNATVEGRGKGEQDVTQQKRKRGASNATGGGGDKGEQDVTQQETIPPQQVRNGSGVDLNSKSATHVANIVFLRAQQYNSPIVQFECLDCLETCEYIRQWLQTNGPVAIKTLVRIEDQKLNLLSPQTKGTLLLFERVASLEGDMQFPISVFVLRIPGDKHLRYFWCLLSPSSLLVELTKRKFVGPPVDIPYFDNPPKRSKTGNILPSRHHMLSTFLAQSFSVATTFPHSPAYLTACQISDVCPSILKPATAYDRIEGEDALSRSHDTTGGKDISDDRYLLEIEVAERALVAILHASCAEYLLIKRQYFKAFSRETILNVAKVRRAVARNHNEQRHATPAAQTANDGEGDRSESPADAPHSTPVTTRSRARSVTSENSAAVVQAATYHEARVSAAQTGARNRALRVRTKNAHYRAVEALSGWNFARAKRLVLGWEILGFLDEERVLAVVDGGEESEEESEDE